MDIRARKAEINLKSLGTGVILFSAWTLLKYVLTVVLYDAQINEALNDEMRIWFRIIFYGLLLIAFLIRFYIGKSARSESEGKRKRAFYIILTGIVLIIDLAAIIFEIIKIFIYPYGILSMIVTTMIDITSLVILTELMVNAIILRKLRKKEAAA